MTVEEKFARTWELIVTLFHGVFDKMLRGFGVVRGFHDPDIALAMLMLGAWELEEHNGQFGPAVDTATLRQEAIQDALTRLAQATAQNAKAQNAGLN